MSDPTAPQVPAPLAAPDAAPPMPPAQPFAPAYEPTLPGPAAALDVSAPLAPAASFANPAAPATDLPHAAHADSLALPHVEHPGFAPAGPEPVQPIGFASAMPDQLAAATPGMPIESASALEPTAADSDPTGKWWAPGNALVLAIAALAWQLLSYYSREQLPALQSSGAMLTNFDNLVSNLPLAGSSFGPIVGILLAAGALAMVLVSSRKGLKEPVLQGAVAALALLSMLLVVALPKLVG